MMKEKNNIPPPPPDWYIKLEREYLEALQAKQEAATKVDNLRTTIQTLMEIEGINKITTDLTCVTPAPSFRKRFNLSLFREQNRELYEHYNQMCDNPQKINIKLI